MADRPLALLAASSIRDPGGFWREAMSRLRRNRIALVGLVIVGLFVVSGVFAPIIAPYNPLTGSLSQSLLPPRLTHLMGTDLIGRDELSRVIYGARISLIVGVVSVAVGIIIGGTIGALAGAVGGVVDAVLMRTVDVLLSIPEILLAIGIVAWLGPGLLQIMLAVGITNAPIFARLLRGSLLAVRGADYVTAARSLGATRSRMLFRYMLPMSLTPLLVQATLALATAIIDVAGLGYLGLGPPDPRTAEWGSMVTQATPYISEAPWLVLFPGLAIVFSVVGFNLLGDGLREALDPNVR